MAVSIKWGIVLGVIVCVWTLLLHALGWYTTRIQLGQYADIFAIVFPVVIVFLAIREQRTRSPGHTLRFRDGVVTGILTGLVSVPITAGFLWIYHHFINPAWLEHLIHWKDETMRARGASAAAIQQALDQLRSSSTDAAQLSGALIGTFAFSLLLSLIFSAILRRGVAE